jgi:RNA polymerase sigma factor (sigma-70 family)
MSIERDDSGALPRSAESGEVERLFDSVAGVLGGMLMRDYGLSEAAIETVLRDAFLGFVDSRGTIPGDPRAWLTGQILERATEHLRLRGIEPEPDPAADARRMLNLIYTQAALATLQKKARQALMLLFHEQKSYEEIAADLEVSVRYAQRLVTRAMAQLRKWKP